jgi:hypothetical protein
MVRLNLVSPYLYRPQSKNTLTPAQVLFIGVVWSVVMLFWALFLFTR